jgi:RNA polymerase sigma factor (sigma-70 family)
MDPLQELATRALVDGDATAWQELFHTLMPRLYGLAASLGVPVDRREDLLHDTWARLLDSAWHPGIPLDHYAFTILRNLWFDQCRRSRRRRPPDNLRDGQEAVDHAATPLDRLLSEEEAGHIRTALARLSEQDQSLIRWHFGEDHLSHAEIGERLGLSESQVKGRCYRAAQKLLRELGKESAPARRRKKDGPNSVSPGGETPLPQAEGISDADLP